MLKSLKKDRRGFQTRQRQATVKRKVCLFGSISFKTKKWNERFEEILDAVFLLLRQ